MELKLSDSQYNEISSSIQPKIEDGLIQSVDARNLHQWLGVSSKFADWIKNQIDRAGLVEHEDFETLSKSLESGRA